MAVSRVIEVSFRGSSVALVRVDTAYFYNNGILFKPVDLDLPTSYQVHWSDSPQATSTLETIGTSEGAPIPDDLWDRSRVIYGWIYLHPTNDSGVTAYEVRIYKNVRAGLPDGTEPTPAEQSTIDQLIGALNSAVEQTGEDAESASQSAQSAESAKTAAESARDTAQGYAAQAQTSANNASASASQASASASASAQSASQSAQIKADIEGMVDDAQGYADSASQSASQASASEQGCERAVLDATSAAAIARARADEASGYAQTASTKASEAVGCVETATQKATESAQSASQALDYKNDAESAKTASQTAQGLAESARDSAITAKDDAEQIKTDVQNIADGIDTRLTDVEDALAEKAPIITDTASGAIASFSDGADDLPLKSLVVDIDPIQDLHGQDSPYPAGGGKNKFDPNSANYDWVGTDGVIIPRDTCKTCKIPIASGTSVTLSNANASSATNILLLAFFDSNDTLLSRHPLATGATYITATAPENTAYVMASFFIWSEASDAQLELGSTPTAYAPYENVCPISGWTQVDVEQRGKNLLPFPYATETTTRFGITYTVHDDGTVTVSGTATQDSWFDLANEWLFDSKVLDDKTLFISGCPSGGSYNTYKLVCVPTGHTDIGSGIAMSGFKSRWFRFQIQIKRGTTVNNLVFRPMVELGSTATPYEPYTGRSITISLGQTVYGGKLDVVSGVLTVDRAMVDLGTLTWRKLDSYEGVFGTDIQDKADGQFNLICSAYATASVVSVIVMPDCSMVANVRGAATFVKDISKASMTTAEFKEAVSGFMCCYELATPIEIQLDSHTLNSLYGVNNLWADSGDTEVEYRADTKLFIERLTAPDSADMVADANIQSGKYFMVGNSLYKATANIANGAQIIVGTNCIRKSLSEALNEINV